MFEECKQVVYTVSLILVGWVPWVALGLLSLPWSLIYFVWATAMTKGKEEVSTQESQNWLEALKAPLLGWMDESVPTGFSHLEEFYKEKAEIQKQVMATVYAKAEEAHQKHGLSYGEILDSIQEQKRILTADGLQFAKMVAAADIDREQVSHIANTFDTGMGDEVFTEFMLKIYGKDSVPNEKVVVDIGPGKEAPTRSHGIMFDIEPYVQKKHLLFCISVGSLLNLTVLGVVSTLSGHLNDTSLWQLIFLWFFSFALAALARSLLREVYGRRSEEAESIDKALLAIFGVYLIQRGRTSLWIYPVLSIAPAATVAVVFKWFSTARFPIMCQPGVNNTLVIDASHCALQSDVSSVRDMLPYVASNLLAIYSLTKTFATCMVKLDPDAKGTLSELKAWEEKQN